jgi:hypothetical protein
MSTTLFTLDEARAGEDFGEGDFADRYPVEDEHSAALAIDAAMQAGLITSPEGYTVGVDLLANLDGEIDGWRILVRRDPYDGWRMASEMLAVLPGTELDTLDVLREAVTMANELLARLNTPPALARERVTSLSGLHGMLESVGYSPVRGIWTAVVLWDGDCRLTSVPISGIEPEYTGSAPAETATGLDHQQWVRRRAAEFRRDFTDNPEARARARQLNDEANTGQEGN